MTENEARQDLPVAKITAVTQTGSRASLVLAVNIEGQDREFALELDASAMTNATSPAEVVELRGIRKQLADIALYLAGIQSALQSRSR